MAWHAIGRGIGRASHLGVKVARAAVIFSSCDSATESGRTNPTPRLRVGLQSTLGLSPDSSVAIDCQNVSPEPGAFDDTAGPARRVCARPFCERCPTSDRLWPKVRETITKPGFRSVTFGLFFIWRNRGSNDSPPASFVAVKGRDCAEGAAQVVSSYRSHADHHDVPRLRRVQDSGGVAARARSARVPRTAARGCCHPVAVPPERASGEGARLRQSVFVRRSDDATKNRSIARTVTDASARVAEAEVTRKNDAASRHRSRWRVSTSPEPLATERGLDDRKRPTDPIGAVTEHALTHHSPRRPFTKTFH